MKPARFSRVFPFLVLVGMFLFIASCEPGAPAKARVDLPSPPRAAAPKVVPVIEHKPAPTMNRSEPLAVPKPRASLGQRAAALAARQALLDVQLAQEPDPARRKQLIARRDRVAAERNHLYRNSGGDK